MKKKTAFIITIIAFSIVVALILWAIIYFPLKAYNEQIQIVGIFNIVQKYIESDDNFIAQYGSISAIELSSVESVVIINSWHVQVPCVVTLETGEVYMVWVDYDFSDGNETFVYIAVDLVNDND